MRFIPLLFILIISIFAGLYIIKNISKFTDRHFDLISLVYLIFLGMILFSPISFDGLSVYLMPAGIGHVNLHELDIFEIRKLQEQVSHLSKNKYEIYQYQKSTFLNSTETSE
ncbi:hypothetical protein [Companilactobacillus halodurans]|uniref:Uncharacterized protein n=1 Tax=Companilactobacillus halodurans TaxID=2584183 RepID=A0A5P0ZZK7_9LACO|nr:hypothetical protein [Companilactobacillus halodurans]MQS98526.1 hypothetical protein [Companilactobacillus halodurans]